MGVSKNRGVSPKMDGENNGNPLFFNGMIWGETNPPIFGNTHIYVYIWYITHTIHVRYIYLHLVDFYGKCRQIYQSHGCPKLPPRRALQIFFEARTRQGIFRAQMGVLEISIFVVDVDEASIGKLQNISYYIFIYIDIILIYVHIYTHGLVSISIHWNIEFLGRLVLIFKFASVLTRLWNLHASNEPGRPDVILLSASISACEKGRQWQHALSLLKDVIWLRKRKDSSGHRVSAWKYKCM